MLHSAPCVCYLLKISLPVPVRWLTCERQRLRKARLSFYIGHVWHVCFPVCLGDVSRSLHADIFRFRKKSTFMAMASQGERVAPDGGGSTAGAMLDHCSGLVRPLWLRSEGKGKHISSQLRYEHRNITEKSYLWLSGAGNPKRARPWSHGLISSASTSLMNLFGLIISGLTSQIAYLLLTAWAALRASAQSLHAMVLILSATEAARELDRKFFTRGREHQHSSPLLRPDDGLAARSKLCIAGRPLRPPHIWVHAEKRLQEQNTKLK